MFCFKCGGSMPDESTVCPQCATPVANAPAPTPSAPPAASTGSAWLNPTPGQSQQYAAQPQAYPGQVQGYPAPPPPTDGKAIASLILGIVSIALCLTIFSGIPAVILGHVSLSSIRKSMGRLKGNGLATAGLIMGYIGIAFGLLYIAVLIPNLTRQGMRANATEAASTVRTINSAQHTYSLSYPAKGYAVDLAALGPGPGGKCTGAEFPAEHACLLDNVLGNVSCRAGAWCTKGAYRFSMSATCEGEGSCNDYVIVATPIRAGPGSRSICSTSDSTLRAKRGGPLSSPITAEECQSWPESL